MSTSRDDQSSETGYTLATYHNTLAKGERVEVEVRVYVDHGGSPTETARWATADALLHLSKQVTDGLV